MPTYDPPTTKYGLPKLDGSSNVQDVDEGIGALADAVDANMAGYAEGTLSARAGVVATAGKMYRTTDTGQVFMGTGSTWVEIGVSPWDPGDLKCRGARHCPPGGSSATARPCRAHLRGPVRRHRHERRAGRRLHDVQFARLPGPRVRDAGRRRGSHGLQRCARPVGGAERVTLTGSESGTAPHVHSSVRGLGFMAIRGRVSRCNSLARGRATGSWPIAPRQRRSSERGGVTRKYAALPGWWHDPDQDLTAAPGCTLPVVECPILGCPASYPAAQSRHAILLPGQAHQPALVAFRAVTSDRVRRRVRVGRSTRSLAIRR
jgi:hypothetical protein